MEIKPVIRLKTIFANPTRDYRGTPSIHRRSPVRSGAGMGSVAGTGASGGGDGARGGRGISLLCVGDTAEALAALKLVR